MGLMVKETGSGGVDFEPIPEGTYEAVCYAVIDLGTHFNETFGKDSHKVLLQFEVPECRIEIDAVDKPRAISRKYTMSLHAKAELRKVLESWRGKAFTPAELEGFDLSKIAGASCMIGVIHETTQAGKAYAKINSIMALPKRKGAAPLKAENPIMVYSIPANVNHFPIPGDIPEWITKIIMESNEWNGKVAPAKPAVVMPVEAAAEDVDDPLQF